MLMLIQNSPLFKKGRGDYKPRVTEKEYVKINKKVQQMSNKTVTFPLCVNFQTWLDSHINANLGLIYPASSKL